MNSMLTRIVALESHSPVDPIERLYPGLDKAIGRCHDALYAALPADKGERVVCGPSSYRTVGGKSSHQKILDLGQRLRAGSETAEDLAVLDTLPADALAVVEVDAKGFVEMFLRLDEQI